MKKQFSVIVHNSSVLFEKYIDYMLTNSQTLNFSYLVNGQIKWVANVVSMSFISIVISDLVIFPLPITMRNLHSLNNCDACKSIVISVILFSSTVVIHA